MDLIYCIKMGKKRSLNEYFLNVLEVTRVACMS